jgi:hypothetical protein
VTPQRRYTPRSTAHHPDIQTVTPQRRYTPRSTAHQPDIQTVTRFVCLVGVQWIVEYFSFVV